MSPKWIHNNAAITGQHALYPQYIEILGTTGGHYQRALQIPLVAPNILASTDSVTITLTVGMDALFASSNDHEPFIGISDKISFIGAFLRSKFRTPCKITEGGSTTTVLTSINSINTPSVTSQRYSSEVKIQLKPAERWGSCHTEHDGGYTNANNYQRLLDPSKGLHVEIYRNVAAEKYRFRYIVVDVELD